MDLNIIWKAILIVFGGTILLRIAGRKSISQMTLTQVVIMIGIGSLLVQPLVGKSVWSTLFVGLMLVLTLVFLEFSQLKSDKLEKFITGKSKIIIKDGNLQEEQLKKLRFTVDQLEMKLRQSSINKIEDVKLATLEPNGQIGYVLKENKQPATKEDIAMLIAEIQTIKQAINPLLQTTMVQKNSSDNKESTIFTEISKNHHKTPPPQRLQ